MAGQAVITLIPYFNQVIERISGQTDRCDRQTDRQTVAILDTHLLLLLVIRDVNF